MIVPAFERRLGTRPWLLRQLRFAEDEEASGSKRCSSSSCSTRTGGRRRTGAGSGRDELDGLRLRDEEQRELLAAYLDALERDEVPERATAVGAARLARRRPRVARARAGAARPLAPSGSSR